MSSAFETQYEMTNEKHTPDIWLVAFFYHWHTVIDLVCPIASGKSLSHYHA